MTFEMYIYVIKWSIMQMWGHTVKISCHLKLYLLKKKNSMV